MNVNKKFLEIATSYFEEKGLTAPMDEFLQREDIRKILDEGYTHYENWIKEFMDSGPFTMESKTKVKEYAICKEAREAFNQDVRANLMFHFHQALKGLNQFISLDEDAMVLLLLTEFNKQEGKVHDYLKHCSMGIAEKLQMSLVKRLSRHFESQFIGDVLEALFGSYEECPNDHATQDENSEETGE